MAILYVLTVSDPINVGPWPASVQASDWLANLNTYAGLNAIGGVPGYTYTFIFKDQPTLTEWLSANTLTDPQCLADIAAWKANYGVTYINKFYTLPETTGTGIVG